MLLLVVAIPDEAGAGVVGWARDAAAAGLSEAGQDPPVWRLRTEDLVSKDARAGVGHFAN